MGMWIGRNRKARVTYGFDEIALVPGEVTINPNEVDTSFKIPRKDGSQITLKIPIIASAMDGVTDVKFCVEMGKLGGLGVINLEGVQTRYENPTRSARTGGQGRQGRGHHADPKTLPGADQGGVDRPAGRGIEKGRRARRREFHSAKGRAFWRHRAGGGRGYFRGAIDRLDRAPYFHRVQIARSGGVLQSD